MRTYSDYLNTFFPGVKVQKISVDAGFSCPNRDGTIGVGGCAYCRNDSFTPAYCAEGGSVASQVRKGIAFFSRKYPSMKYLAYFQSYTNTHGRNLDELRKLYMEALAQEGVVGLVIGTRPDTLPDPVLHLLGDIGTHTRVFLEIGAETSCDDTLRAVNRHHTWHDVEDAVRRASAHGLHCGLHLIAGLPGEDRDRILRSVDDACRLPIDTLKVHQLQILKGTPLCARWKCGEIAVNPFTLEDYLDLCVEIVRRVPSRVVIERFLAQSPPQLVEAPRWGLKNYLFANLLAQRISELKTKNSPL